MSQYIDRREAAKSYRPVAGSMSPGLKRAREPYRLKNALLGISLAAFAVGIWAYSISAVRQDVFDDVDEEVIRASSPPSSSSSSSSPPESPAATSSSTSTPTSTSTSPTPSPPTANLTSAPSEPEPKPSSPIMNEITSNRGVLPRLFSARLPWLLDPTQKTLVWGAPPVDNVGKMSRRS